MSWASLKLNDFKKYRIYMGLTLLAGVGFLIVKGFEYEKGEYAVLDKEDFKRAALEKTETIDVLSFVPASAIDSRYFETPYYLAPGKGADRAYALLRETIRKTGKVKWLRPDAKTQVSVQYVNDQPVRITNIVISTQHSPDAKHKVIKEFCIDGVIRKVVPRHMLDKATRYLINPTGRFVVGGPQGDTGLTGRKIIVDSYGGMGRHGGGAFSGKDPSKVDRSAAYMGRYVAKNIVASGLATSAEIQFAYAIGHPDPVSVCVNTFGTGKVPDELIEKAVCKVFSFKPADIVKQLNLLRPIYSKTTNYGHFGKVDDLDSITWERTDKAGALKRAVK